MGPGQVARLAVVQALDLSARAWSRPCLFRVCQGERNRRNCRWMPVTRMPGTSAGSAAQGMPTPALSLSKG